MKKWLPAIDDSSVIKIFRGFDKRKDGGISGIAMFITAVMVAKLLQPFAWLVVLAAIAFGIRHVIKLAEKKAQAIDNPPPRMYDLPAEGVWAQVLEALRTVPPYLPDVSVHIDHTNPTPQPGQPIVVQASLGILHPELLHSREMLPIAQQSLRSKIVLRAYVKPVGNRSELTLQWTCMPIISRQLHDFVIDRISENIDTLIQKHTSQK